MWKFGTEVWKITNILWKIQDQNSLISLKFLASSQILLLKELDKRLGICLRLVCIDFFLQKSEQVQLSAIRQADWLPGSAGCWVDLLSLAATCLKWIFCIFVNGENKVQNLINIFVRGPIVERRFLAMDDRFYYLEKVLIVVQAQKINGVTIRRHDIKRLHNLLFHLFYKIEKKSPIKSLYSPEWINMVWMDLEFSNQHAHNLEHD